LIDQQTPEPVADGACRSSPRADRVGGHPVRSDPVIRGVLAATVPVALGLAVDVLHPLLAVAATWVLSALLCFAASGCAGSAARRLAGQPSRRFWLVMCVALGLLGVGNASQTAAAVADPDGAAPVTYTPVLAVCVGLALCAIMITMITYPVPFETRLSRGRYWLDLGTVMVVAVTFGVFFADTGAGVSTDLAAGVLRLVTGPVMQVLTVFGVAKLLLGPSPPFTRTAGVLGALGPATSAIGTSLAPVLRAPGRHHWFLLLELVTNVFILACARAQQLGVRSTGFQEQRPRHPYSLLPYLAVLAVYGLLAVALSPERLAARQWMVVAAAAVGTALVMLRQLAAFADNARLLLERERLVGQLEFHAFHDGLTGLANRALFFTRLQEEIARCERHPATLAVLLVDLDDFKPINDRYGHDAGDAVLVACARRMIERTRAVDLVARLGGDEFAIILTGTSAEAVDGVVRRIIDGIAEPVPFAGHELRVSCSVGGTLHLGHLIDPNDLLTAADEAMYRIKRGRKGGYALGHAGGDLPDIPTAADR
jgi:diguanylate cyclase (GGDEF)-like protein